MEAAVPSRISVKPNSVASQKSIIIKATTVRIQLPLYEGHFSNILQMNQDS
jgi:hypothetical protein